MLLDSIKFITGTSNTELSEKVAAYLGPEDIITGKLKESSWKFMIDLGLGEGNDFYYTCDLTPEYVEINKR